MNVAASNYMSDMMDNINFNMEIARPPRKKIRWSAWNSIVQIVWLVAPTAALTMKRRRCSSSLEIRCRLLIVSGMCFAPPWQCRSNERSQDGRRLG
jgi:hypothetical protein